MNPDSALAIAVGDATRPPSLSLMAMLYYGLFGLPLAMLALPIYVYVPQFYAQRGALTLAVIGAALLAARTVAAFIDPLLGWWITRAGGAYRRAVVIALPLLIVGYTMLFHPPLLTGVAALCWFLLSLMLVYTGFSLATIAHQSWGAALTQQPGERSALAAVRESCGLLGVMTAAVLPAVFNYDALSYAFAATLLAGAVCLLYKAPRPPRAANEQRATAPPRFGELSAPFRQRRFRALFLVQPDHYAQETPTLDIQRYFNGTLDVHGMFQNRAGTVEKRFTVLMRCSWNGDVGTLDEEFVYSDGTRQRRVWTLRKTSGVRYTGTAPDVVGEAKVEVSGSAMRLQYVLALPVGDKVYNVDFDDWMYLIDDRVMLNRAQMSKFNVGLGSLTVVFNRRSDQVR